MMRTINGHGEPDGGDDEIACSILVPVLNEQRQIAEAVAAMRRQRFDGEIEILLADGGSDDGTREILEALAAEDPRIRVLDNPRRTTPSGLNVALAHARGRWVCRMDAHAEFDDDHIALGVERLARGDTRWVSGPPIATGHGSVSRAVALALRTPLGRGGSRKWADRRGEHNAEYELDAGVFAGVWERETLLAYGGWDEGWPRNQDSEMAGRFLERGEKLICLEGMASHYTPRNSLRTLWRQYLRYGEFREKTARRHPQTLRRSHLLAPSLVVTLGCSLATPRPVRRLARAGLLVYGCVVGAAGIRARADAERPHDALLVPAVLVAMHTGHGVGMLRGAVRYGPPLAALASMLGLERLADRLAPAPEPVFAPSLAASEQTAP